MFVSFVHRYPKWVWLLVFCVYILHMLIFRTFYFKIKGCSCMKAVGGYSSMWMSVGTSNVISYRRHGFTDTADTRLTGFYLLPIFLSPVPISLQIHQFYRHAQYVRWILWIQAFRLVEKVPWSLSDFFFFFLSLSDFLPVYFHGTLTLCFQLRCSWGLWSLENAKITISLQPKHTKKTSETHRLEYSKALNKNNYWIIKV